MSKFVLLRPLLALIALTLPTHADEAALYDAPIPDDAAFVRFLGFEEIDGVTGFDRSFSGERLTDGRYNILRANGIDQLEPGAIMTIVPGPAGTPQILPEPPRSERKVMLRLLNLENGATLALKTADGSTEIIAETSSGQIGAREVNPIQVDVAVYSENQPIGQIIPLSLHANRHLTIVVTGDGQITLIEDAINPDPMQ